MSCANRPLVSVIMCVYNAEAFVGEAIESVLNQTVRDLELIIVDDGSADSSGSICDSCAAKDSRVRVFHKENGGIAFARNLGLKEARGKLIAWLDSDDTLTPDMLELMLALKEKTGVKYVKGNYTNIHSDHTSDRFPFITENTIIDMKEALALLGENKLTPVVWSTLADRELYDGIEFPVGRLFEDVRITYRLIERAGSIALLAKPTTLRRVLQDSISHRFSVEKRVDGSLAYIERYNDLVTRHPELKNIMLTADFKRAMHLLRRNIANCPYSEFRKCRKDIRFICGFYRQHADSILPKNAGFMKKLLFGIITSGTYAGFYISRLIERTFKNYRNWLGDLSAPM